MIDLAFSPEGRIRSERRFARTVISQNDILSPPKKENRGAPSGSSAAYDDRQVPVGHLCGSASPWETTAQKHMHMPIDMYIRISIMAALFLMKKLLSKRMGPLRLLLS